MAKHYSREHEIKPFSTPTDPDEAYKLSHAPQFKDKRQYVQAKLKILVSDFRICPTKKEIEHLYELSTESEINRAVRQIMNNHWR